MKYKLSLILGALIAASTLTMANSLISPKHGIQNEGPETWTIDSAPDTCPMFTFPKTVKPMQAFPNPGNDYQYYHNVITFPDYHNLTDDSAECTASYWGDKGATFSVTVTVSKQIFANGTHVKITSDKPSWVLPESYGLMISQPH